MTHSTSKRAWMVLLLAGLALAAGYTTQVAAQKASEKKRTNRLPAHYAKVVTEEQRTEIYAIQDQFEPKLAKARAELKALVDERDAAIEKVLTAQQRKEVAATRAEAAERRREALSKLSKDEAPQDDESSAAKKGKAKGKKAA